MTELPLSYLKEIATQVIFISVFLGGFSATFLGTLVTSKNDGRIYKALVIGTALSAIAFIVTVFAMTSLVIMSTPGYPLSTDFARTKFPRIIGFTTFIIGIFSLMFVISISGWLHSKRLGLATLVIGLVGLVLILMTM